ncbi:MAG: hypothetical protein O3A00_22845, partial [Planctomycetota bacterium]|nr:hypothetical protein [Planctomycetota bacterium]
MNAVSMVWLLASLAAEPGGDFVLKEHLGREWTHECVSFPVTANLATKANAGIGLLGADGKAVAYQVVPGDDGAGSRISFQTDFPAYGTAAFRFGNKPVTVASDLKVEEGAEVVTVTNGRIGLKVRRKWKEGFGPIAGLRLASGEWTGESLFVGATAAVESYDVVVRAKGPVFAEVECRVTFADQGTWKIVFRVEAGEPVVLVDESFDAPSGGVWSVVLGGAAFRPTHMFHRNADVSNIAVMSDPIAPYHLEPWLKWSNPRHGTWVALHSPPQKDAPAKSSDMLMIGLMKPSLWVDPQWKGKAKQPGPFAPAAVRDGLVAVDFTIGGGRRAWLLGTLDQTESIAILSQENRRVAPPPQKLLIKHGDFPLEKVKDFVLEWPGDPTNFPRLYVRKQDLPAIKARLKPNPAILRKWISEQPINKYLLDEPVQEFLAGG